MFVLFLLLVSVAISYGQTTVKIHGKVMDADSQVVSFAAVRLPGLAATQTDTNGYFAFTLSKQKAENISFKPGVDVKIIVEKPGMVMLDPPELDPTIRLPLNWTYQKPFEVYLATKGSPVLLRSERMLERLLQEQRQATIEAKEYEFSQRDVFVEAAYRLGVGKQTLLTAVIEYKSRQRTSTDLIKRHSLTLDDAIEATDFQIRQHKLKEAKKGFHEALQKDELAAHEGREAESRLPEIYNSVGLTFFIQAQYDSAAFFFEKADSARPGHALTLSILGETFYELAQYERALQVHFHTLHIDSTTYGYNHPNVARNFNNIGTVLLAKGDHRGALSMFQNGLKIDESHFGRDHPVVATRLNNIATVYEFNGDYNSALSKYQEALEIFSRALGPDHLDVAIELNNIGNVFLHKAQYDTALTKFQKALKIIQNAYGELHPLAASSLNGIGSVYKARDSLDVAIMIYRKAQSIVEKCLGPNHPKRAKVLGNLASAQKAKKNYKDALENNEWALRILKESFGPEHPAVAIVLSNLAGVLKAQGKFKEARELYSKALEIDERFFGRNHPNVAIRLNNLGTVLETMKDYYRALEMYDEAIAILTHFFEHDHPIMVTAQNNRQRVVQKIQG